MNNFALIVGIRWLGFNWFFCLSVLSDKTKMSNKELSRGRFAAGWIFKAFSSFSINVYLCIFIQFFQICFSALMHKCDA